jgi:hypothetical protein
MNIPPGYTKYNRYALTLSYEEAIEILENAPDSIVNKVEITWEGGKWTCTLFTFDSGFSGRNEDITQAIIEALNNRNSFYDTLL